MAGLLLWMTGRWALLVLILLPVLMSVTIGQVDLLMAAAIVVGFRWPAAWALPILTKVTPGVGLLWFAVRREWRSLAIALGATAAIVAVSFAINADAWLGWLGMLGRGQFPRAEDGWYFDVPLGFRLGDGGDRDHLGRAHGPPLGRAAGGRARDADRVDQLTDDPGRGHPAHRRRRFDAGRPLAAARGRASRRRSLANLRARGRPQGVRLPPKPSYVSAVPLTPAVFCDQPLRIDAAQAGCPTVEHIDHTGILPSPDVLLDSTDRQVTVRGVSVVRDREVEPGPVSSLHRAWHPWAVLRPETGRRSPTSRRCCRRG